MADETERLIAIFEARLADFERNMKRAPRTTRQTRQQIEREADQLKRNVESKFANLGGSFSGSKVLGMARGALGMAGIGLGAGAIANLTSEWSDLNSRVANAVGSMSRGEEVMGRIAEMARRSYSSLSQTTDSFIRNADALTELGYATGQQLDMAEALNNAMVISATRGQQAEAVHRAWTNALALGELRGQNLNTVIQGSTRLTKALADSMGVSTNELRKLGAEGKITSTAMVGVTRELETLRAEADAMPATLTDSFVLLGNSLMQFLGQVDQATGATSWLAGEIIALSDSIEESAQRWKDGDVPLLQWMEAAANLSRELGLLRESVEDTRTEIEQVDDSVAEARLAFADLADQMSINENMRAFAPDLVDDIQEVVDKLLLNEISADDARDALLALGQQNLDFSGMIGQLAALAGQLRTVTAEADAMHAALNSAGGPTGEGAGRGGAGASRRAAIERQAAMAAYTAERERVLALSREQLALEQAIAREIKDAADAGVTLSAAEAERLARMQLAQREANKAGGRSGSGGRAGYEESVERVRERIMAMQAELSVLGDTAGNSSYELERLRIQQELLNEAAKAGIALSPDQLAAIDALATSYATVSAEIEQVAESQEAAREAMADWLATGKSIVRGFIDDLVNAKTAAEALGNAFASIGNKLIDLGLSFLFSPSTWGIPGFANGTRNAPGGLAVVGERGKELVNLPRGSQVIPHSQTLAALRTPQAPRIPEHANSNPSSFTYAPQIDARGADIAAVARIERILEKDRAEFDGRVKNIVKTRGHKWR